MYSISEEQLCFFEKYFGEKPAREAWEFMAMFAAIRGNTDSVVTEKRQRGRPKRAQDVVCTSDILNTIFVGLGFNNSIPQDAERKSLVCQKLSGERYGSIEEIKEAVATELSKNKEVFDGRPAHVLALEDLLNRSGSPEKFDELSRFLLAEKIAMFDLERVTKDWLAEIQSWVN